MWSICPNYPNCAKYNKNATKQIYVWKFDYIKTRARKGCLYAFGTVREHFRTILRVKKVRFEPAHSAKGNIVLFWGSKKYDWRARSTWRLSRKQVDDRVDGFALISSTFESFSPILAKRVTI